MIDLALTRQPDGRWDISKNGATTRTIEGSIILSLFCDARDDNLGERGYWADPSQGSKLWTLSREKMTADLPNEAKKFCEEALAWLIEEGHAEAISVDVRRVGVSELSIMIEVDSTEYRYKVEV